MKEELTYWFGLEYLLWNNLYEITEFTIQRLCKH